MRRRVEDCGGLSVGLVHPVRQGSRRGLVDDVEHAEPRDISGSILVEMLGQDDHNSVRIPAQEAQGDGLHLPQDHGLDLTGAELFPAKNENTLLPTDEVNFEMTLFQKIRSPLLTNRHQCDRQEQ